MRGALCVLCLLSACTRTTELLGPPPKALPYCPTTMDVYGGTNASLVGCGGETNFFSEPGVVNCEGAQPIVDRWYQSLKAFLLARAFVCPSASGG